MLEKAGFTVHEDDLGTALTIEAPETAFQRAFGVGASAEVFPVPPELRELVDTILPVPKPILF